MNTSSQRLVAAICLAMLFVLNSASSFAVNYTWTGNSSSAWNTTSNWSPGGSPGANDTVNISDGSGSQTIQLNSDVSINRLVISGREIDLNTRQLTISSRASLNGGSINNGSLIIRGTYAFFQGTNFNSTIDCITGQIKFSGGTFEGKGSFEHNGSANGWGEGGCVFNDSVKIKSSGTSYLRMGQSSGDTFNGAVEFISTGTYPMQVAFHDSTIFKMPVSINSTSGGISFCNDTTVQAAVFKEEAFLLVGSTGITGGTITLKNIYLENTNAVNLTASGSTLITVVSSTFNGKLTITSPGILSKTSTYNDSTSFTRTANNTTAYQFDGGNIFNGVFTLTSTNTSSGVVRMASKTGDKYNGDAYFNTTSTAGMEIAYSDTSEFKGNIFINHSKVVFNKSKGVVRLTGDDDQVLQGNATFLIGKLKLNKGGGTITLNRAMTIDSLITFTTGIITTDSVITLKAATTCSGASNQSFVDGPVKKIGNTAFVFPVGDEGRIGSIEISAPVSSTESFTARYFERPSREVSDSIDTSISIVSQCNYWYLNRNTGTTNVKVRLYWDTIGCALFDTTSIRIAEFTGSAWKGLGKTSLNGNSDIGNCQNFDNVTSFNYFTIGVMVTTQNVDMQLNSNDRPIQKDFFGFNGANTIERNISGAANQTWADIYSENFTGTPHLRTLAYSPVNTIRYPAGTLSNYFDWRAGWYIREQHLPNNWLYDKPKYRIEPDYGGNELADFAQNLNLMAARPILVWNVLTSKLTYEIASTYRLGEVNLPLNYIELGNEFYLNDDQYKEVFPSVMDYLNKSREWIQDYRSIQIPQSTNVKFAVVGSDYGDEVPGRRKLWLKTLLDNISPSDGIAAVTVHDYIGTGLSALTGNCLTVGTNQLKTYLNKAFKDGQTLRSNTFADIQAANQNHLSLTPLEIWLTEFNNLDDENSYIGTWPHGLFNAAMALQYLETPEVSKVISHTMISDGVFGNIFESTNGFDNFTCHGETNGNQTRKGEFTTLGNALNQIAMALHNATNAKEIEFTPQAGSNIPPIAPASPYPVLYGWYFENTVGEKQIIVLNLDFNPANDYNLTLPTGIFTGIVQYDQLTCSEFQNAIMGNAILLPPPPQTNLANELQLQTSTLSGNSLTLTAGSLTRIYQQETPLQLKLTDSEICEGSTTSLVVSGGNGPISISPITGLSISQLNLGNSTSSDHYWEITANNSSTAPYSILVSDGVNSELIELKVHDALIDLEILANGNPVPITGIVPFCPGSTPLTLSASFNPGSVGTNSNPFINDYHFIWAPDTGIVSSACSTGSFLPYCDEVDVNPERTTKYTIYVTDDHCWQSTSVLVEVPISSVNLGPDFNACAGANNPIVLEPIVEAEPGLTLNYSWSTSQTSSGITLTSLAAGANVYTVTVTATFSGGTCSVQERIQINGESCCTGIANSVTALPVNFVNPETGLNEYYVFGDQLYTAVHNTCPSCAVFSPQNSGLNNTKLDIDLSSSSPPLSIIINQTLVLRNDILDVGGAVLLDGYNLNIKNANILFGPEAKIIVRQGRKLTLENCTLNVCGSEMWKGIEVEPIADDGEPHIILKNCVIMNAEQSILLGKNAQFEIENCTFTDNYIDIFFEKYSKKNLDQKFDPEGDPDGMATQNFIRSNTFTSSGTTLLAPYNTVHKFAAIVLDDVERVVVGDSSLDGSVNANEFSDSRYGIISFKSNLEVYNNSMYNLLSFYEDWPSSLPSPWLLLQAYSVGIYHLSAFDFNDRKLTVGESFDNDGVTDTRNRFFNINYQLWSKNESNIEIHYSDFGLNDGDAHSTLGSNCILIEYPGDKVVNISNDNQFDHYLQGTAIYEPAQKTEIRVLNNKFYGGVPLTGGGFAGTGVVVSHLTGVRPEFAKVMGNEFMDAEPYPGFPRIGIRAANIAGVEIDDNLIQFDFTDPPGFNYSGIWTTNCYAAKIRSNTINNIATPNDISLFDDLLVGVRVENCHLTCIESQELTNLGMGMHFTGNSMVGSLFNNTMENFDEGIHLANAEIGAVQGGPWVFGTFNDLLNEWIQPNGASVADRIKGVSLFNIIEWWHSAANTTDPKFPGSPVGLVQANSFPSNITLYSVSQCSEEVENDPPMDLTARNANFGAVAADTARYDPDYWETSKYQSELVLFATLKKNPELLDFNDSSDIAFQAFYEYYSGSNLEKVVDVQNFFLQGKYVDAGTMLSYISDTLDWEINFKGVMGRCIDMLTGENMFDENDSLYLDSIAHLNVYEGGLPVLMARNALKLEIYDAQGGGSRIAYFPKSNALPGKMKLVPNPATNEVAIILSGDELLNSVKVFDRLGSIVLSDFNKNKLSIVSLKDGVYIVEANTSSGIKVEKLVVIR